MTPFYIIETSAPLDEGVLALLLDSLDVDSIWLKDKHNRAMMDYFLKHRSQRAVLSIKMGLQKVVQYEMDGWGCTDEGWMSDLSICVNDILCVYETRNRKNHVDSVVRRFSRYLGIETTSIVELAIWKLAIRQLDTDSRTQPPERTVECNVDPKLYWKCHGMSLGPHNRRGASPGTTPFFPVLWTQFCVAIFMVPLATCKNA